MTTPTRNASAECFNYSRGCLEGIGREYVCAKGWSQRRPRSKPRGRFPFTTRTFVLVSRNGGESLTHPPNTQIDDRPLRILTLTIMSHRTAPSDAQAHLGCPVFDEHCDCGVYFVHGTTLTAHRGALTWGLPSECHIGRNVAGIKSLHTWDYTAGPAKPSHAQRCDY